MRRRALLATTGSVIGGSLTGCVGGIFGADETESFDESYDVTDGSVLTVTNRNGDVTVRETGAEQLTVSGEKRAGTESGLAAISVDVETGEQTSVGTQLGSGSSFSNRSVELVVDVPTGMTVETVSSANGDVTVEEVSGDVSAVSSNGDVEVRDVDGYARCESTNGDVRARGTTGLRGARTSNGTVDVEVLAMRDDVTCRSTNGSVTVRVGPDVAAAISLTTSNGDAAVRDLPHTTSISRPSQIEGHLRGGTAPQLTLESSNGDVTLRPAEN